MTSHLDMRAGGTPPADIFDRTWLTTPTLPVGTDAAVLKVAAGRFEKAGNGTRVFTFYPAVAEVISSFSTTQPAATFSEDGGPEAFEYCPPNADAGGPVPADCDALADGLSVNTTVTNVNTTANGLTTTSMVAYNFTYNEVPGPPGVGGKLRYAQGANRFGGTFSLIQHDSALVVFCQGAPNPGAICSNQLRAATNSWKPGQPCVATPVGATLPRCAYGGSPQTFVVPQGVITVGPVFGTMGSIVVPGTNPGLLGPPQNSTFGAGFPMSTGTIIADDNIGTVMEGFPVATKMFTQVGYDNRTSSGGGNIKLVGGAMFWGGSSGATYPRTSRLYLKAGPVAPLAGPGIFVALGILAGGYALRRRINSRR